MTIKLILQRGAALLTTGGEFLQPVVLLTFRLHWGWALAASGYGKLVNHERVVEFFTSLGIPAPGFNSWFVGGAELIGGALLFLGLFSRPAALIVAGNMTAAYLSVEEDRAALFGVLSDAEPFISADPFFFLVTSLLVLAFGPGVFSIDALLRRKSRAGRPSNRNKIGHLWSINEA